MGIQGFGPLKAFGLLKRKPDPLSDTSAYMA